MQDFGTETATKSPAFSRANSGVLRWEEEMYEPLADFLRCRGMVVLREVRTYQGRIDLVGIRLDSKSCRQRMTQGFTKPIASLSLLQAFVALPEHANDESLGVLSEKLAILPTTLRKLLRELVDLGVVHQHGRHFQKRMDIPDVASEVICCEAKLTAWQAVVRQAYAHRFYAHRSFVALNHVSRHFDAAVLERRHLGLLQVRGRVVTCQHDAPTLNPTDRLTFLQLQELAWTEYMRTTRRSPAARPTSTLTDSALPSL